MDGVDKYICQPEQNKNRVKTSPLKISSIILLFLLLGFFREFFFVNVNALLYKMYYHDQDVRVANLVLPLEAIGYQNLYWLKYVFTLLSISLFFGLSLLSVRWIMNQKKVEVFVGYTYLLLVILAALSMGFGYFINNRLQDDEYTLSRWLLGVLQSPLPALFFIATGKLLTPQSKT